MIGARLKRTRFYKELRHVYRAFVLYRKPFAYLYYRFFVGSRLRRFEAPLSHSPATEEYSVHLLCNHDGIDLLLWSLASWYQATQASGPVYIHEDGSFTAQDRQLVGKIFPHARIVDRTWAAGRVQEWLKGYSASLRFRKNDDRYIYALKLIDPYFVSTAPARLVLDIDVLWFQKPAEALKRLLVNKSSFMMQGPSVMDFQFAHGEALPPDLRRANAGIIGYQTSHYSLSRLEEFMKRSTVDNPPRLTDQAGYAYVLSGGGDFGFLDEQHYSLKSKPQLVARHYTGPVREKFWFEGVKLLRDCPRTVIPDQGLGNPENSKSGLNTGFPLPRE